jgi:ketosteroid isomerase-like protein
MDLAQELAQLKTRVQYHDDLEAVRNTWLDYCNRLDSDDWPALADVYTPDGVLEMVGLNTLVSGIDGQYRGRRAIINDFYIPAIASAANIGKGLFATGHLSTNMQIKLDGDSATTLAYFFEIVANNTVLIGTYQHKLQRDPDRCVITRN